MDLSILIRDGSLYLERESRDREISGWTYGVYTS